MTLIYCLRYCYKMSYPTRLALWGDFFAISVNLLIYWFTSKAFVPNFLSGYNKISYFDFLVVSELALLIPTSLILTVPIRVKSLIQMEHFNFWLYSSKPIPNIVSLFLAETLKEVARILMYLIVIYFFFQKYYSLSELGSFCIVVLAWFPFFLGISIFLFSGFLLYGRGVAAVYQVSILLTMLSGAYFPTSVLPEGFRGFANILPTTLYIDNIRTAFNQISEDQSFHIGNIILWTLVSILLGFGAIKVSIQKLQNRGGCDQESFL